MKELKYEAPKVEIIEVAVEKGYASTDNWDSEPASISVDVKNDGEWGDLWGVL